MQNQSAAEAAADLEAAETAVRGARVRLFSTDHFSVLN
jgi:hypothetical protein